MSANCSRFVQNAWKKDLCSNCFKSKEEHANLHPVVKLVPLPLPNVEPAKSIMKSVKKGTKKRKVSFPKEVSEIIGFGGEWSSSDVSDTEEEPPKITKLDSPVEEIDHELIKVTKTNTDFNTNKENLLVEPVPDTNIKRSFVALKLGSSTKDAKKPALLISVTPFAGANVTSNKVSDLKQKLNLQKNIEIIKPIQVTKTESLSEMTSSSESIEPKTIEKSLMDEISETLLKNKTENILTTNEEVTTTNSVKLEISNPILIKSSIDSKRAITRHIPIKKDQAKPKINVFQKQSSESDGNSTDTENGISAYYDVVESSNSYENVPDGFESKKIIEEDETVSVKKESKKSKFFSSQLISDMFLSKKTATDNLRKRSETYNLSDCSYISSKITPDGLIVTKNSSEDVIDSSGSSFDSSSDEEMSSMNRSESDSGIGIPPANDYQNVDHENRIKEFNGYDLNEIVNSIESQNIEVNLNNISSNTDYEDIQAPLEKSRELSGEPDGRSDPDGSAESAPALPTSPPPILDARTSFLHGIQSTKVEKPKVPAKPTANLIKTFAKRPQQNFAQQQVILQLQQVMKQPSEIIAEEKPILMKQESLDLSKTPKKGRAPNPPPSPVEIKKELELEVKEEEIKIEIDEIPIEITSSKIVPDSSEIDINSKFIEEASQPSIYMRNPYSGIKSNSPVVREKDKRERAIVNPKFRSLNNFTSNRNSSDKNRPNTPEPAPRKSLSLSQESLTFDSDKKKKNKFSIKKFLRMGTNSKQIELKDEIAVNSESGVGNNSSATPTIKPRLVIIHPLDTNTSAVEIVKDMRNSMEVPITPPIVTGKPPAPPVRNCADGNRLLELNKPARPPPPKSAELRRKQKMGFTTLEKESSTDNVVKDNLYANLGEVRSSIAPRKPERTNSMRERDAQLELPRRRPVGQYENVDCDSSDTSSTIYSKEIEIAQIDSALNLSRTQSNASEDSFDEKSQTSSKNSSYNESFNERKKKIIDFENNKLMTKVEIFERNINETKGVSDLPKNKPVFKTDGIKNSVQKMSNTIDSYLKDKMTTASENNIFEASQFVETKKAPCLRDSEVEIRNTYDAINLKQQRISLPDNGTSYSGSVNGSTYRRGEFAGREDNSKKLSLVNLPRAISMSYCGSEMGESEIYSPYSFCGSEASCDVALGDPHDGWGGSTGSKGRSKTTNRLRMRKGRSVVHKNLEDNYGAVVVANHEALAQVLDQLQQSPVVPVALRPLANTINLRFDDFAILEGPRGIVVGRRAFHTAIWANHTHVTLALSADCNQMSGVVGDLNQMTGAASGALNPITEFCDLVPNHYLPLMPSTQIRLVQATISVLPRMHVDTLQSLGAILKSKSQILQNGGTISNFGGSIPNLSLNKEQKSIIRNGSSVQNLSTLNENSDMDNLDLTICSIQPNIGNSSVDDILYREVGFVMLQLVNGLKNLQAKGIEEMPASLPNVILCKEIDNKEAQARLCVLQGSNQDEDEEPNGTLCQCAHIALTTMLPTTKLSPVLSKILLQERSESLSKAKSILEFAIWGPSDVTLTGSVKERELALQRWLDLERATVLHGLVRTRVELTVYDECHLMFLVRSNAKILSEASSIISSSTNELED